MHLHFQTKTIEYIEKPVIHRSNFDGLLKKWTKSDLCWLAELHSGKLIPFSTFVDGTSWKTRDLLNVAAAQPL